MNDRTPSIARAASHLRMLVLAVVFLLALCSAGQGAQVRAQLDRSTVTLGESLNLTLVFEGIQMQGRPDLPPIPNFQVDQSRTSSGFTFNGQTVQHTFQYALSPIAPGDFVIPSLSFRVGAERFTTQPIAVKVVKPSASVPNPATGTPTAFLKLVVPKNQIYVGEMMAVEVHLFAQEGRLQEPPQISAEGFALGKMPEHTQSQTTFNNQRYALVVFRVAVMPVRTGPLTLGPATMPLLMGPYDFFGRPQRRATLATDPVTIQVLPVPTQNVPPAFSGAVGNFTLDVSAGPTNVTVGDPVTVKVRVSGRGKLEALALPDQPDWREFKTYPPSGEVKAGDDLGLSGVKNFEQVVIPQNHEIKALPPFLFSFFDPEAKTFRTLSGPAIPLTVRAGASLAGPLPTLAGLTNRSEQAEKPPEIATIKVRLGALTPVPTPLFRQGWFLALQLAPPALWLSLLARRRYVEALSRNPRLLRQRQVAKLINEGLRQLHEQAAAQKPDEFFATLFRLLQEQIGERLDLPASAITEAVVDERLRPLGVEAKTLKLLHGLFQECNLARYAAARTSGELTALVPKVEAALETLQRLPEPGGR